MMKRLRCTYSQLLEEPAFEMLVFEQFAAGEGAAEREIAQVTRNTERVVQQ